MKRIVREGRNIHLHCKYTRLRRDVAKGGYSACFVWIGLMRSALAMKVVWLNLEDVALDTLTNHANLLKSLLCEYS